MYAILEKNEKSIQDALKVAFCGSARLWTSGQSATDIGRMSVILGVLALELLQARKE